MNDKLALFGGEKVINKTFPPYRSIGQPEAEAVAEVMRDGELSRFLGVWHEDFYGGPKVLEFEANWARDFNVAHAVSVNSNTSGLIAALGAIDLEPGDEVIVSPWTMSASATSILVWNAIPVFADIEQDTFNLCPKSIEANITARTKAIMLPDIFGHAPKLDEIMKIARRHGLKVIEDAAQAPGAMYKGQHVGTVADIGVYSLNYHKHIHTGEGGVCVTNDPDLADRMQLIRNHAESVVEEKGTVNLASMIGFNFRMTELQAAIGIEQLKKLPALAEQRMKLGEKLNAGLGNLGGLKLPIALPDCTHVYYAYGMILDTDSISVSRDKIAEALRAEGVRVGSSYANVHLLPIFQKKIAYGKSGFPWTGGFCDRDVSYEKGICPVAENLQDQCYLGLGLCVDEWPEEQLELTIDAFHKVWRHLPELAVDE